MGYQHKTAIYLGLTHLQALLSIKRVRFASPAPGTMSGPLPDITVVDLSRVQADLGARVIKVEPPGAGDDARRFGPFVGGCSVYYESLNRGKTAVILDLMDAALPFATALDETPPEHKWQPPAPALPGSTPWRSRGTRRDDSGP